MTTDRRWPFVAIAVIGIGLALAPAAFQMFTRAPKGADMIDGFGPYMEQAEIDSFRSHLATIGAARDETTGDTPVLHAFVDQWPAIDADMSGMLDDMERNLGAYRGIAALPPFGLFPWFFVVPGVLLAAGGLTRRTVPIAVVAVGLLLAPVAFQLFTRAPAGAAMIEDFEPFMTEARVARVQGDFLTIGNAEGQLRQTDLADRPATRALVDQWQPLSADMAPMIGAMADNVGNFEAVAALPPFGLFPWFFVGPAVLTLGLLVAARPRKATRTLAAALAVAAPLSGCGGGDDDAATATGTELAGVLTIAPGTCDGHGSWFRMVQSGGTVDAGPFVANADSPCPDQDESPLTPGTDGGIRLGDYQPQPDPPFAADGTSSSTAIITPQSFFAVRFGISTNRHDPQSGDDEPAPVATVADDGTLTVDLRAFSVAWNGQFFNQGATASGSYDGTTGAYALDWTRTVEGGPFDGFTGVWHLEGSVRP